MGIVCVGYFLSVCGWGQRVFWFYYSSSVINCYPFFLCYLQRKFFLMLTFCWIPLFPPLSETMFYLPPKGWTFYLITSVRFKVFVFLKDASFFSALEIMLKNELSFLETDINETSTCSYITESHIQARKGAEAPICIEVSIRIQWNRRVKRWKPTLQQYYESDWFPILS